MKDEKTHVFDKQGNVRRVVNVLTVLCVLLLGADFFFHRHVSHPWEGLWGFYAVFGFVACVVLVLLAKEMRKLVMRDEDYYDRADD